MMNTMLQQVLLSGTARGANLPGWQAAGKTGTSQDYRDAWFIGYTSHLVTGVWLGNDDNSPTKKAVGGGLPVEIWSRFMRVAHQGVAPTPLPGLENGGWFNSESATRPAAPCADRDQPLWSAKLSAELPAELSAGLSTGLSAKRAEQSAERRPARIPGKIVRTLSPAQG